MRRTKEDAEKTRIDLLDAAKTVFKKKGYYAANLMDIAEVANVTRGAIAWHFQNKKTLFREMVEADAKDSMQTASKIVQEDLPPNVKMEKMLDHLVNDRQIKHDQITILNRLLEEDSEDFNDLKDKIRDAFNFILSQVKKLIEEGITTGIYKSHLNADFIARGMLTFLWGLFTNYELFYSNYSTEQLQSLVKSFFNDLLSSCNVVSNN